MAPVCNANRGLSCGRRCVSAAARRGDGECSPDVNELSALDRLSARARFRGTSFDFVVTIAIPAIFQAKQSPRFSLRTLLIAMTLVSAVLGLIVSLSR